MVAAANVANTYVVPTETTVSPYYDDFNEAKNFHRILFRPGYAIQARELTQLQTILQNQIERFGRHIFENGSPVIGGTVTIPTAGYNSLTFNSTYGGIAIVAANLKNKNLVLRGAYDPETETYADDTSIVFRAITTTEETVTDSPSAFGSYITEAAFEPGDIIKVQGEQIFATFSEEEQTSSLAFIKDSVFFFNGYFVKVPSQATVIGKYTTTPMCRVGLEFDDDIVTEDSDSSLLDPALESTNYQAPGASRYKMDLILTFRPIDSTDDSKFIELARVVNGVVKTQTRFPVYSEIEEVLARRTFDESGNYTVRPFNITFDVDQFDPVANVTAWLQPGKGYIQGYEFETISDTPIHVPKARTTNSRENYDYSLNYGNYVIVNGLNGLFDISTVATFDIHCVNTATISTTSNATYQTTKIGTAKTNFINYYGDGGDATNVNKREYEFYLFDTQFRSITSNIASVVANTITIYQGSTLLGGANNCYNGATVRFTGGTAKGGVYRVVEYDKVSKTLTLDSSFGVNIPDATTNVSIDFDFSAAETFYISKAYTPGGNAISSNANAEITVYNKSGGEEDGNAIITEPTLGTLLFKLPNDYIAANIQYSSYQFVKKFDKDFVNGVISFPMQANTNEDFQGATSTSNISSTVLDNFLVVVTNKGTSSRSNGDIVKVTATVPGDNTATVSTGNALESFSAAIFARMEIHSPNPPKKKVFVESRSRTLSSQTAVKLTGSSTGSSANVYLADGQVVISSPTRQVGIPETLYISDVLGIAAIYDLNGSSIPAPGGDLTQFNNVTERFDFDNGQRDTHYDHASIRLKPNYASCKGPLVVCCYYFRHESQENGSNFFSIDSYFLPNPYTAQVTNEGAVLGDGYSVIPAFRKSNGEVIELRDCIDFRPARKNASNAVYQFTDVGAPVPATDLTVSYDFFYPRKDLIVLNANRQLQLIQGEPDQNPKEPSVPLRTMPLYVLTIPPYTKSFGDIRVKFIDNKRYTMRDIGKIDKRVENLEYYVSLNTLEKAALDVSIPDVNGLERTKYGVFVDSFTSHILGNANFADYSCAISLSDGFMTCRANTTGFFVAIDRDRSTDVRITRDKVLLDYTETSMISQPYATKDSPLAEFSFGAFEGNIVTIPEGDIWKDTTVDPDIVIIDQASTTIVNENYYNTYNTFNTFNTFNNYNMYNYEIYNINNYSINNFVNYNLFSYYYPFKYVYQSLFGSFLRLF